VIPRVMNYVPGGVLAGVITLFLALAIRELFRDRPAPPPCTEGDIPVDGCALSLAEQEAVKEIEAGYGLDAAAPKYRRRARWWP
jgi:hypothetical protein